MRRREKATEGQKLWYQYYRVKPRWLMVKIADEIGQDLAVGGCLKEMILRIVGSEANEIENTWHKFWQHGCYRGVPVFMSVLSGVDIALWDLKGKNLKVPVYELLGGKVRNQVQVYSWIGGGRPSDVEIAAAGLQVCQMNATEDLNWLDSPSVCDAAVERLKVIKSLGLDADLHFHGRVHKAMAKQLASALEPLTTIPIALGDRLYSRRDVKRFLEYANVDILQPDAGHAGGISETRRIAAMAEVYDVAIAPHCPPGPVAFAACLQIAVSSANFTIPEMSIGVHYNMKAGDDIDLPTYLKDPKVFDIADGGYVKAPTGDGLGIEIDEEMVKKFSADTLPRQRKVFHGPDGSIREW
ncbi:galactonate dehydratase [Xylaria sp. CBS 124048]|nr:galactonate dehydratase [Xylaria sp. CBS 124048]